MARGGWILAALLALGLPAAAQQSELEALKAQMRRMAEQMQALQQRIAELEAKQKAQPAQGQAPGKVETKKGWDLGFSGVIFADFRYNLSNGADDFNGFNLTRTYIAAPTAPTPTA